MTTDIPVSEKWGRNGVESVFFKIISDLVSEDDGASAVEYAILASLVAAVVAVGISTLGTTVLGMLESAADAIGAAM